jgi:hypothetical protein
MEKEMKDMKHLHFMKATIISAVAGPQGPVSSARLKVQLANISSRPSTCTMADEENQGR